MEARVSLKITAFKDLMYLNDGEEVICLNSGGLDSAYLICKLVKDFNVKVRTLTLDIGQSDRQSVILPSFVTESILMHTVDAKDEFANDYVMPLIQAQGMYLDQHPLSASLSRPLIAKHLVKLANECSISTVLHSATPTQNSMRRFNQAIKDLDFTGYYGSPYMMDNISRMQKIRYIEEAGGKVSHKRLFSIDSNLFCREFESGELNNPEDILVPECMFEWTTEQDCKPCTIELKFEMGIPTHLNGNKSSIVDLIQMLNLKVGKYGLGRYQGLEEGPDGIKVLEVRETPAGLILLKAIDGLINANFDYKSLIHKKYLDQLWTCEAVEGRWFGTLKKSIDAFNTSFLSELNGTIRFELTKRRLTCTGIKTSKPKYATNREQLDAKHNPKEAA